MTTSSVTPVHFGASPLIVSVDIESYKGIHFKNVPATAREFIQEGIQNGLFATDLVASVSPLSSIITCDCVFPVLVNEENISDQTKETIEKNTVTYMKSLGYAVTRSRVHFGESSNESYSVGKIKNPLAICSAIHKNIALLF